MKVGDTTTFTGGSYPGRAKATQEVNLSFRVSGPLIEFPVEVGTVVEADELLAKIDPRDYQVDLRNAEANLAGARAKLDAMKTGARPEEMKQLQAAVQRAQAAYDRAQSDYNRDLELLQKKVIAQKEFDRSRQLLLQTGAELRAAQEGLQIGKVGAREEDIRAMEAEIASLKAAVEAAEDQVKYTDLKAPFAGIVAARYAENFETVRANQLILRLLDISQIEMEIHLPERVMPVLKYAEKIWCRFDQFKDLEIPAEIKEIGTEASLTTRTYPVTLIMDQPKKEDVKILPGMAGIAYGSGKLPQNAASPGIEIPVGAVFTPETEKQSYVWVVDEQSQTVQRRPITPGRLTTTGMVGREGLQVGERVVTAGVHSLREEQKVRILAEEGRADR